jgi:hypothetical protein
MNVSRLNVLRVVLGVLIVTLIGVSSGNAQARPGRQGFEGPGPGGRGAQGRGGPDALALDDLLDSYVLMQSQQRLQLSPDQTPQFVTRLRELQVARRRARMQRNRMMQELGKLTLRPNAGRGERPKAPPPRDEALEGQIRERLKGLEALETQSAAEIKQAQANLDQVLTPFQQARFRILEEQLERQKVDLLMQARRGGAPALR